MNHTNSTTERAVTRLLSFALLFTLLGGAAFAQTQTQGETNDDEPDFIVPARPTASNPAEFQSPGVLQIEYGFNGNWRARDYSSQQDTPLALRLAVTRRLLFELDTDSPFSQKENGVRETGAGDTQLGAQVNGLTTSNAVNTTIVNQSIIHEISVEIDIGKKSLNTTGNKCCTKLPNTEPITEPIRPIPAICTR